MFQSRNRGSFGFKGKTQAENNAINGFNLVIEVLLVSSLNPPYQGDFEKHYVSIS